MLAIAVALAGSGDGFAAARNTALGLLSIAAFALLVARPGWQYLARRRQNASAGTMIAFFIIGAVASATITDRFNLHAVFGAFVFGLCLPRHGDRLDDMVTRIYQVVVPLLLPVFFVVAGLATTTSFLGYGSVLTIVLVILVATAGKVGGA